jgi:hypothetical protein
MVGMVNIWLILMVIVWLMMANNNLVGGYILWLMMVNNNYE